jgi:hypothetical protein
MEGILPQTHFPLSFSHKSLSDLSRLVAHKLEVPEEGFPSFWRSGADDGPRKFK